jgi:hypothetical protein
MCVGSHLAVYRKYSSHAWDFLRCSKNADSVKEMKYIIAALYSNYTTTIVDDTDIEQSDSYTAPPKSDKLIVKLEKLQS